MSRLILNRTNIYILQGRDSLMYFHISNSLLSGEISPDKLLLFNNQQVIRIIFFRLEIVVLQNGKNDQFCKL